MLEGLVADIIALGVILKDNRHHGKAEEGNGAHRSPLGNPVHLILHGNGDQALHLLRRVAGKEGDDLYLDIGHVRIGFDGQPFKRGNARENEDDEQGQNNRAMSQRVGGELADHDLSVDSIKAFRSRQPSVTTFWPALTPLNTWTLPSCSTPNFTN